ncbi:MAG: 2-C-methyl-D-erythritol 4-phosphate cytidylyltransferase [Candidatus Bipolaricaulota bacterium]|nr:2-C-methyl-D-erythritol 4-phosphate cytidylyltransferase [Candidatus Bipolaricaulota bacterium]
MKPLVSAILLAAGRGTRIGAGENKIYLEVKGEPLLAYTLRAFSESTLIDEIVLVVAAGEEARATPLLADLQTQVHIVRGGRKRQDSSRAGVSAAKGRIVLIHDAARPFPSQELIARVITGVKVRGACVPVLTTVDTLRYRNAEGFLLPQWVERRGLLQMQTPQGFRREIVQQALAVSGPWFTDDAGAVLGTGAKVWTVTGERDNFKVTTKEDLALAEIFVGVLTAKNTAQAEESKRQDHTNGKEESDCDIS